MKPLLFAVALFATAATSPLLAADVGISVSMGDPGYFGRIDIGGYPQPRVIYSQPIAVERVAADRPPLYLRVPPGYAKHWKKHCREYSACGERVFFVRDDWYSHEFAPRYREKHRGREDEHRSDHRGERHDDRRDDRGR